MHQLLLTVTLIAIIPTVTKAQNSNNSTNTPTDNSAVMSDTTFIRKNIMDNAVEIQLSQLGRQKSTNPQIKSMAEQMIADHTQILNELKKVARQENMTGIPSGMGTSNRGINAIVGGVVDSSGAEASSASRSASGTAGAGMATASSGNRALGTGMNAASGSGAGTTGTGVNSSAVGGTGVAGAGASGTLGGATGATASGSVTGTANLGTGTSGVGTNASSTGTNTSTSGSGTGTSRTRSAASASGSGSAMQLDIAGMQDVAGMQALQNARGSEFNNLFVSQMLQMHQAKVSELQTALARITDPILKAAVTRALPKIKMHRDMLATLNGGTNNSNGQ